MITFSQRYYFDGVENHLRLGVSRNRAKNAVDKLKSTRVATDKDNAVEYIKKSDVHAVLDALPSCSDECSKALDVVRDGYFRCRDLEDKLEEIKRRDRYLIPALVGISAALAVSFILTAVGVF